jgi:hypothetical protein
VPLGPVNLTKNATVVGLESSCLASCNPTRSLKFNPKTGLGANSPSSRVLVISTLSSLGLHAKENMQKAIVISILLRGNILEYWNWNWNNYNYDYN